MSCVFGSPLTERDLSIYVTFVAGLVIGRLSQSDAIMNQEGQVVEKVARYLRSRAMPSRKTLYRGWLLDPRSMGNVTTPEGRATRVLHGGSPNQGTFLSFSERRDVACFFADPDSEMSSVIMARKPELRGYLMTYKNPDPSLVLWTHEWRMMPVGDRKISLVGVVAQSSTRDAAVVDRNLREQYEVVTKLLPRSAKATMVPLDETDCPPSRELDRLFGDA